MSYEFAPPPVEIAHRIIYADEIDVTYSDASCRARSWPEVYSFFKTKIHADYLKKTNKGSDGEMLEYKNRQPTSQCFGDQDDFEIKTNIQEGEK